MGWDLKSVVPDSKTKAPATAKALNSKNFSVNSGLVP